MDYGRVETVEQDGGDLFLTKIETKVAPEDLSQQSMGDGQSLYNGRTSVVVYFWWRPSINVVVLLGRRMITFKPNLNFVPVPCSF